MCYLQVQEMTLRGQGHRGADLTVTVLRASCNSAANRRDGFCVIWVGVLTPEVSLQRWGGTCGHAVVGTPALGGRLGS